jgi:hypothetical protein
MVVDFCNSEKDLCSTIRSIWHSGAVVLSTDTDASAISEACERPNQVGPS